MSTTTTELNERSALPGDMLAVWNLPVLHLVAAAILLFSAFANHVVLDVEKTDVGLDQVVFVKLMFTCLGMLLALKAFLADCRIRDVAGSWPGITILWLFVIYAISSLLSSNSAPAIASSVSIPAVYLLTITVAIQLGRDRLVQLLFAASSVFVLGSWLVYFLKPEIGVLMEPLPDGTFARRMSGLSHPNTLGQYAGMNLLLGTLLIVTYRKRSWIYALLLLASVAALVACLSRTSMLAFVLAIIVGYREIFVTRGFVKLMLIVGILVSAVSVFLLAETDMDRQFEQNMALLSKSGQAEEITSGTGRSRIWAKTIQLIRERPSIGYGPATSKELLADYSSYAHNLILNIVLSTGFVGGFLGLLMCVGRIAMLFQFRNPVADSLMAFILVNGIFENIIFSTICGFPTICWTLALTWFAMDKHLDS